MLLAATRPTATARSPGPASKYRPRLLYHDNSGNNGEHERPERCLSHDPTTASCCWCQMARGAVGSVLTNCFQIGSQVVRLWLLTGKAPLAPQSLERDLSMGKSAGCYRPKIATIVRYSIKQWRGRGFGHSDFNQHASCGPAVASDRYLWFPCAPR